MKFAYCGYDFFWTVLDALLSLDNELLALFTFNADGKYDFNTNVFKIATMAKCPIKITPITVSDAELLCQHGCEMLICAAYPYKIPDGVLARFKYAINIHPSLLPEGRGPWPMPWAILNQLKTTGVTIHNLSRNIDHGDILLQESFSIDESENLESLSAKTQIAANKLIKKFLENPDYFINNAVTQQGGTYFGWPNKEVRTVNWDACISDIDRTVRAFSKFEAYGFIDGERYYIRDVTSWECPHEDKPGTVVHRLNKEIVIAAKDGYVCVRNFELAPNRGVKP